MSATATGAMFTTSRTRMPPHGNPVRGRSLDEVAFGSFMGTDEHSEGAPLLDRDRRIDAMLADIDARLTRQLAAILERTHLAERPWRLWDVVCRIEPSDNIEVAILGCTKEELASDGLPLERTALFDVLHEPLRSERRGAPYAAVLADYSFGKSAVDLATLREIGRCAARELRLVPQHHRDRRGGWRARDGHARDDVDLARKVSRP